ncbi:MAG: DNA internalization-related competence protein ComEC/Rec2 [Legionellaceae bacterium]|nr:DNA internalization-related competence protein ComEC/Rec2 [Legionellaceae bacterium]
MIFFYKKSILPWFLLLFSLILKRRLSYIGTFCLAIILGFCHQELISDKNMPDKLVINNATLVGRVMSIPVKSSSKIQFQFEIRSLNGEKVKAIALMSCYQNCPDFVVNQSWQIKGKIQKPRNLSNPGGFDFIGWLSSKHVSWTGNMKKGELINSNDKSRYSLISIRNKIAEKLNSFDLDRRTLGILQALSLGVTNNIDSDLWDLFRRTGTTHLMVISGAHIGLVSGMIYLISSFIWARFGLLSVRFPSPKIASIFAMLLAISYSLLAGFSVSVKRALIACLFVLSRNFLKYRFSSWQAWRYAILTSLIIEPHAVLFPGFYLSFISVAILITMNGYISANSFKKAMFIQFSCLIGLMPLTMYWFSYGSVNGFFANLLAIPFVGFFVVPLSLLITIMSFWFNPTWLIYLLSISVQILLDYLHIIDSLAHLNLVTSFVNLAYPISIITGLCIFIFMPIKSFRIPAILLFCLGVFPKNAKLNFGEVVVDILDVGQGLAIVVRTANYRLIYDTGIKFYKGSDMGNLVIIPYLKTLGVSQIDKLVISHPDLDHRGGLPSIERAYPVGELIVDNYKFYNRGLECHSYPDWEWDGVSFHFFKLTNKIAKKNNSSCVLQIKNNRGEILLTGDIEQAAEDYLIARYKDNLHSKVLVVPHHASKTSSSMAFLTKVNPEIAVASYGFNNKYHFPHEQAIQNYNLKNIKLFNTLSCGMIRVKLNEKSLKPIVTSYLIC